MKTKLLFFSLLMLAMGGSLLAQNSASGNISATSTNCFSVASSCVWESPLPPNAGTSTVAISGTFSATLLVEESNDGGKTWATAATLSAAGTTTYSTNGFTDIRVRCSAYTSGTAVVTISTGLLQVQSVVSSSSSSSSSSLGPVINVTNPAYAGGASSALADNNAAFTAAFAASNALKVTTPVVAPRQVPQINQANNVTSVGVNAAILAGETAYVFVTDAACRVFTITDSGGSSYSQLGAFAFGGGCIQVFRSTIAGTLQSNTVTATQGGAAESMSITAVALPAVASDLLGTQTTGSSTAPSISQTTTASNSFVLAGCTWFNSGTTALVANAGTILTNGGATSALFGLTAWGALKTTIGSVTNSGTLGSTSSWACQSIEIKSGGTTGGMPTVYFPGGLGAVYFYSGGINPTIPTNIECQRGTTLFYTGSGKAMDIGPPGLTNATQLFPFFIKGCTLSGGLNYTHGIYLEPNITKVGISECYFLNFGNFTGYMIAGSRENWDVEVGPQNRIETNDYQQRKVLRLNLDGISNDSFLRFHDNNMFCLQGPGAGGAAGGCIASQAGTGIDVDSTNSRVYHNNIAFFNPNIIVRCTNAPCSGPNIGWNQIETVGSGAGTAPIQFANTPQGMVIHENSFDTHATGKGAMEPINGSALLNGLRFNFNSIYNIATSTPFVAMNNLAGQTGNQSSNNECTVVYTTPAPCTTSHTAGASISAWSFNADDGLAATGSAPTLTGTGACATITTQKGSWTGQATCTGTTGASTFIITPGSTAANGWQCDASDITTANALRQSVVSTTACTIAGTVNANDVLTFKVVAY